MKKRSKASGDSTKGRRPKAPKHTRRNAPDAVERSKSAPAQNDTKVARLTRELSEAREQQTAMAEVLRIISSSPGELERAFESLLQQATSVCHASFGNLVVTEGDGFRVVAIHNAVPAVDILFRGQLLHPHPQSPLCLAAKNKRLCHIDDLRATPPYVEGNKAIVMLADVGGARTFLTVPLLKKSEVVGVIVLYRNEVRPFSDRQIVLVENFAAQAVIAIENARLLNELRQRTDDLSQRTADLTESLQQQTATADVLKVISRSTFDLQIVLDTLTKSAAQLCAADKGIIFQRDGEVYRLVANYGFSREAERYWLEHPRSVDHGSVTGRALLEGRAVHVPDVLADPEYRDARVAEVAGYRTGLAVPLLREGTAIGVFALSRDEVKPFTEKQIELMTTFADQAVIAIENARLLSELRESLAQQTATADVLKVISRSTFDLHIVLDTLTKSATQLCAADLGLIFQQDGDVLRLVANFGVSPEAERYWLEHPVPVGRGSTAARALLEGKAIRIPDVLADPEYRSTRAQELAGYRSTLSVPLVRDGTTIGVFALGRREPNPFTDKQAELVTTFADQAVIAIENARLLNELRARTDDLTESLEQQTATSEVLRVISSSPGELETVFATMLEKAVRICDAAWGNIHSWDGRAFHLLAMHNVPPSYAQARQRAPIAPPHPKSLFGGLAATKSVIHFADAAANEGYIERVPSVVAAVEHGGGRTMLGVPMLKDDKLVGAFTLIRQEVRPFADKQIALITSFANQAVIAIENARLLTELRESLQQQTATADVLKVISRSAFDLQTVLDTLLQTAARLCDADQGTITQRKGNAFYRSVSYGFPAAFAEYVKDRPVELGRDTATGRALVEGRVIHIPDVALDPEYTWTQAQELGGFRTLLGVPMLREGVAVGVLTLTRIEAKPFTDKQIELVSTFADQAAIAIENTRLFQAEQQRTQELIESLDQQTATSKVLDVISRSAFDLRAVFEAVVESSVRLCGAERGVIYRFDGETLRIASSYNAPPQLVEWIEQHPFRPGKDSTSGRATARAALERRTVHIPDVGADPAYASGVIGIERGQTFLAVPILKGDALLGVITIYHLEVRPFTDKQIALVETFADQAAIAIENVRLFESVEARTRELAKSLDDLRTAQDRLVQTEKLASLGQLTAGIAHEIKNPLNFVNNFSAISAELVDELREALGSAHLDSKLRAEIGEITEMLEGNLGKVVQHGKRADAIVKNMLLHSRQGSGEHRPVDINALVDESLNLAYHGARAEKQSFNITLERSFDPAAGEVDLFPQEITRVLLNLVANGFYAATKRKEETSEGDYEPVLTVATKNLGDTVEIRIRDNGTGIPPEVREKLFNPFFTTKPAGEGTGLGLSISHDIIVKQHSGSIEVDTRPGQYTEFRIVLPRAATSANKSRGGHEPAHSRG